MDPAQVMIVPYENSEFHCTKIRVSATQFIVVRGDHQFYNPDEMYDVMYSTQSGFIFMNEIEIHKALADGTYKFMKFRQQ